MFFQNGVKDIVGDIEYICKLMFQAVKTPIHFLDNNNDIYFSYSYGHVTNPLHQNKKELFTQLFTENESYIYPVVRSTKYHENYFAVTLIMDDIFIGTFIVGPSAYSPITAEVIDSIISENNISLSYKRELIQYYNSIPIIDYVRLINASQLLHYCIYNEKLETSMLMEKNSSLKDVVIEVKTESEKSIAKNRQDTSFHHTPSYEKKLLQCISEGNKEKLLQCYGSPLDGEIGILSKNNPLRSIKNLVIALITVSTRAAMDGGLNSELAYSLSDSYIQRVEEINEMKDLFDLQIKMLCDFTNRVREVKQTNYSKTIILCQNYIFKHLYEDISLSKLAEFVGLAQNYLSELFSKEVGMPISKYIQKERIEEAKRLLISSNYSILDIATWLNFHDQSHFTRQFKEFTGTTPKKYRDKHF